MEIHFWGIVKTHAPLILLGEATFFLVVLALASPGPHELHPHFEDIEGHFERSQIGKLDFLNILITFLLIVHAHTHLLHSAPGNLRTCKGRFFPSTSWVARIKSSGKCLFPQNHFAGPSLLIFCCFCWRKTVSHVFQALNLLCKLQS